MTWWRSLIEPLGQTAFVPTPEPMAEADQSNLRDVEILATAAFSAGRHGEAMGLMRSAIAHAPTAELYLSLGGMLGLLGRHADAAEQLQRAVNLRPDLPRAHNGLGVALEALDEYERAIGSYRRAIHLQPRYPEAHNNLANALRKAGRVAEAVAGYHRAISLRPAYADAYSGLGVALVEQRRVTEAIKYFERAVAIQPDHADAHLNFAGALLLSGDFERGWREYEWRWRSSQQRPLAPAFAQPQWDGSDLAGRTILLHAEQGFGDTFQFVRYVPLVARRGGQVMLSVQRPLAQILRGVEGAATVVPSGEEPLNFDLHAPLMSLPRIFGTTIGTVPAFVPYLRPEPDLVRKWHHTIRDRAGYRIGINWQASNTRWGRPRSLPLEAFAVLAAIPGVRLICLQKGAAEQQLHTVGIAIEVLQGLDESSGAFLDTAAVMQHLDLVITVDTSIAHLAGALGVPVWVALPFASEWRWLLDRDDTPWYPTMRLFRQPCPGDWFGVLHEMAIAVNRQLSDNSHSNAASPQTPRCRYFEVEDQD